jgi:dihydrolipoamide dehydrogenase
MADYSDVLIIGAGPGGYVAAIRAAQLGLKVTIVERSHLGGICLNWGCIPTKALLTTGEVFGLLSQLKAFGVNAESASFDLPQLVKRSRAIAQQLSTGVGFLMKKNKIDVVEGTACLEPGLVAPIVIVDQDNAHAQALAADAVILATGARPKTLPKIGLSPDRERVWTYREALVPERIPATLLIIGGGAIGIEFASFYRAMGSDVTVVEALDRILPNEDAEISIAARKALEKRGIQFLTSTKVLGSELRDNGIALDLESPNSREWRVAEVALLAVGVLANIDSLGLEALGV